jgi:ribosome-associated translation inhibitor RaiA
VSVEAPHKHHHKGKLYAVHIDLRVPGGEIVASREPGQDHSHEDVYVAVRDAFDAVGRQLQDLTRIRQGQVKHHEPAP